MTDVYVRYLKIDETTKQWQYATRNRASSFVKFGGDDDPLDVHVGTNERSVNITASNEHSSSETLACAASDITFAKSALPITHNDERLELTATCRTIESSSGSGYVRVKKSG